MYKIKKNLKSLFNLLLLLFYLIVSFPSDKYDKEIDEIISYTQLTTDWAIARNLNNFTYYEKRNN